MIKRVTLITGSLRLRSMLFLSTKARQADRVTITIRGTRADGKSPLALLALESQAGDECEIEVTGPNAREILDALCAIVCRMDQD